MCAQVAYEGPYNLGLGRGAEVGELLLNQWQNLEPEHCGHIDVEEDNRDWLEWCISSGPFIAVVLKEFVKVAQDSFPMREHNGSVCCDSEVFYIQAHLLMNYELIVNKYDTTFVRVVFFEHSIRLQSL